MTDHIIKAAREAGIEFQQHRGITGRVNTMTCGSQHIDALARFYAIAFAAGMERAAEIAEDYCHTYHQTKDAHERLSMQPFSPERYGFSLDRLHQSERIADNIRAHAQNPPKNEHDTGNV